MLSLFAIFSPWTTEESEAHDHVYPGLIALAGSEFQYGRDWSVTWISRGEEGCAILSGNGASVFRKNAAKFDAPGTIRLEFAKEQRPESVSISVARKVRKRGLRFAAGKRTKPDYQLEPVVDAEGDTIRWAAIFQGFRERHYYVTVRAGWQDVEGCGGLQTVAWVVHLQGV